MGFIWFILFIIFLILWLNVSSELKRSKGSDYQRGLSDGYEMAKDQTRAVRGSNQDDTKTLDQFLDIVEPTPLVFGEQATIVDSSANQPEPISIEPGEFNNSISVSNPEEVKQAKTAQTLKNLNIILYVASFLIVAATAIFVTLTMPAGVKLMSLVGVTIAFYGVGLFMYSRLANLRPAAIAFVGTGLAIIPFIGFALTSLGNLSNEVAWLITSVVGLVAYATAAIRMQSQLVSYITMAFVLSLALSAVSILSLGVMWYFVMAIGVSLVINCIYILAPKLLSELFTGPLRDTGLAVTPVALVASLFAVQSMELWMYIVLFAVATAHYIAVWLIQKTRTYELIVRVLAHITAVLLAVDMVGVIDRYTIVTIGVVWLGLAALQVIYSLWRVYRNSQVAGQESIYVGIAIILMVMFMPLWHMTSLPYHWSAISLSVIGLVGISATYMLKRAGWLYGTLVVSVLLPFIIGREIISPELSFGVIAGAFVLAGAVALFCLERLASGGRPGRLSLFLNISVWVYSLVVAFCGVLAGDNLTLGWTMAVAAGMLIALSYLNSLVVAEVVGAVLGVVSIAAWVDRLLYSSEWQLVATIVVSVSALAVGAAVHQRFRQSDRRDSLVAIGMLVLVGLVLTIEVGNVAALRTATLLLVLAGIGGLVARGLLASRGSATLSLLSLFAYIVYPVLALVSSLWLGGGWLTLVLLVSAGIAWVGSYVEKRPGAMLFGNVIFAFSLAVLWWWLEFNWQWALYGVTWISAGVYYLTYWYSYGRQDARRMDLSLWSALVVLSVATIYGLADIGTQFSLSSAGSMLMVAGILAMHGYLIKHDNYMEMALYVATAGTQWLVHTLIPEVGVIVFAHWWAVVVSLGAMWRNSYKTRLVVALGLVTASTGFYALTYQGGYTLFFLAEHLIMAIAGAMLRKQWAMWWGIIAVVLAVLYFLRDYTFLALLFIGLLLILFVVWRLTKIGGNKGE